MADHIWTVICNQTLVHPDSKVISLIDVAESLHVPDLEKLLKEAEHQGKKGATVNATLQLVSWWFRSDFSEEVSHARFALLSPSGGRLLVQAVNVTWGDDKLFSRIYLNFDKLPVVGPGLYWFVVEQQNISKNEKVSWVSVAKVPLHIT